ncbi:MAG: tRNA-dihydrouridine synthase family protein, partial [Spirochaetales bacterium]|nr:tRNA-dihydrouridine synthase family protein [Spirochaetales bacterium]
MKTALAPMATLSHEALRLLIHRWGDPDEYFSEMINASTFVAGGKFEHWYVRSAPCPERMVWQLTGASPDSLSKAASLLAREGGIGVDINMGCSAPDIAKTGAGVAWMGKPLSEVAEMVGGVRRALDTAGAA